MKRTFYLSMQIYCMSNLSIFFSHITYKRKNKTKKQKKTNTYVVLFAQSRLRNRYLTFSFSVFVAATAKG